MTFLSLPSLFIWYVNWPCSLLTLRVNILEHQSLGFSSTHLECFRSLDTFQFELPQALRIPTILDWGAAMKRRTSSLRRAHQHRCTEFMLNPTYMDMNNVMIVAHLIFHVGWTIIANWMMQVLCSCNMISLTHTHNQCKVNSILCKNDMLDCGMARKRHFVNASSPLVQIIAVALSASQLH